MGHTNRAGFYHQRRGFSRDVLRTNELWEQRGSRCPQRQRCPRWPQRSKRIRPSLGAITVSSDYISGSPVSDSSTYDNQALSSLGATPGTYIWTWGTGSHADSFTLQIGPAQTVPEPGALTLMAVSLAGLLGAVLMRTRRV
jgi:hypothetical protein